MEYLKLLLKQYNRLYSARETTKHYLVRRDERDSYLSVDKCQLSILPYYTKSGKYYPFSGTGGLTTH